MPSSARIILALSLFSAVSASGCCSTYATSGCLTSEALREHGNKGETAELVSYLGDERSWVREESARVLGRVHARAAKPELERILQSEEERVYVRAAAAEALGNLGDPSAVPLLAGVLARPGVLPELKLSIIFALCSFKDSGPEPVQAITPLASDEDVLVAAVASSKLASKCRGE